MPVVFLEFIIEQDIFIFHFSSAQLLPLHPPSPVRLADMLLLHKAGHDLAAQAALIQGVIAWHSFQRSFRGWIWLFAFKHFFLRISNVQLCCDIFTPRTSTMAMSYFVRP
jgi:hypothetical protein